MWLKVEDALSLKYVTESRRCCLISEWCDWKMLLSIDYLTENRRCFIFKLCDWNQKCLIFKSCGWKLVMLLYLWTVWLKLENASLSLNNVTRRWFFHLKMMWLKLEEAWSFNKMNETWRCFFIFKYVTESRRC